MRWGVCKCFVNKCGMQWAGGGEPAVDFTPTPSGPGRDQHLPPPQGSWELQAEGVRDQGLAQIPSRFACV